MKYLIGAVATLLALIAAVLVIGFTWKPALAGQGCIGLDYRPGGNVYGHVKIAEAWASRGECIVIKNWQESAAAIQVAVFVEKGGKACYIKSNFFTNPTLRFHKAESIDPKTGKASYDDSLKRYAPRMYQKVLKATGKTSPRYGMLPVKPSILGIPQCPKAAKVKTWLGGFPIQIYRLR